MHIHCLALELNQRFDISIAMHSFQVKSEMKYHVKIMAIISLLLL